MVSQDFLKRWFGYTRRERTGTFILVLIVIIVTIARIRLLPGPVDEPVSSEGFSEAKNSDGYGSDLIPSDLVKPIEIRLKTFNPNTATAEELISLGLSERQSSTVINYREAGGVFSSPQDFRKIYGITPLQFDELIPYIIIPEVEKTSGELLR
ncbi:MAG: helix-hairpin-helix domain-containing protein [Bacteroidia bacterium]|nr:MAG: helix-hairpin-helix domain-containing protein [Bacteroidia bacterium]